MWDAGIAMLRPLQQTWRGETLKMHRRWWPPVRLALETKSPNFWVFGKERDLCLVEKQAWRAAVVFDFISISRSTGSVLPLLLQPVQVELLGCFHPQAAAEPAAAVVGFDAF
jgi:hypothetical protein